MTMLNPRGYSQQMRYGRSYEVTTLYSHEAGGWEILDAAGNHLGIVIRTSEFDLDAGATFMAYTAIYHGDAIASRANMGAAMDALIERHERASTAQHADLMRRFNEIVKDATEATERYAPAPAEEEPLLGEFYD